MAVKREATPGEWDDIQPEGADLKEASDLEISLTEADEATQIERQERQAAAEIDETNRQLRREHIRRRMLSEQNRRRTDSLLARLGYKLPEDQPNTDIDS